MHHTWLEALGRAALSFYVLAMGGLMGAIVFRAAVGDHWLGARLRSRRSRRIAPGGGDVGADRARAPRASGWRRVLAGGAPPHEIPGPLSIRGAGLAGQDGRLSRFFFEYVGNVDCEDLSPRAGSVDRRRNRDARLRLDWLREQMKERGFPATKTEEFIEDLREVIRHDQDMTSAEGSTHAVEDPPVR